jgi:hypothetical protein
MSYLQNSTVSANGLAFLNASQSLSSTPGATPPPPKGSQMSSFGMSNGMSRSSFGGYDGGNDYGSQGPYQNQSDKPQIYRVRFSVRIFGGFLLMISS